MRIVFTLISLFAFACVHAQTDSVYTKVQIEAQFPGGPDVWAGYLKLRALKPVQDTGANVAIITFTVRADDSFFDIKLEDADKIDAKLTAKMIKAFQEMPHWKPAINEGRNVAFRKKVFITTL